MSNRWKDRLPDDFEGTCLSQVPMRNYTTFCVGGPADVVDVRRVDDVIHLIRLFQTEGQGYHLLGGGSNLVIDDAGLTEPVIVFRDSEAEIQVENEILSVSAAMPLDHLARWCADRGLEGFSFAVGIPGTVGGAIVGNAGAFGRQVADCLESVELLNEAGQCERWAASRLGFGYRQSRLKSQARPVLSARFRVAKRDRSALMDEMDKTLALRHEKHPDLQTVPSAGSFFQNIEPKSSAERRQAAGYWLEKAGAKSMRVGDAAVFEKHANMIVNLGQATAQDILTLAKTMRDAVREQFGVSLLREVRTVPDALGAGLPTTRDA